MTPTLQSAAISAPAPVPATEDSWIDLKGLSSEAAIEKLQQALNQLPPTTDRAGMEAEFGRVAADARDDAVIWQMQYDRLNLQRERARTAWEYSASARRQNLAEQKAAESTLETMRTRITNFESFLARLRSLEDAASANLEAAILDRRSYWLVMASRAISPEDRETHSRNELASATDTLAWEMLNRDARTMPVVSDIELRSTAGSGSQVQLVVEDVLARRSRQFRAIDDPFIMDVGNDSLLVIQICAVQQVLTDRNKPPVAAGRKRAEVKAPQPSIIFDPSNARKTTPALARLTEDTEARQWLIGATHRLREFHARTPIEPWKIEVARAGDDLAQIHKALRQADDEQREIGDKMTRQQGLVADLRQDGAEIDLRYAQAGEEKAAAEAAFSNHIARRTLRLYPGSADEMTRKLDNDDVPSAVQGAKLPELFRRLRGNALKVYRRVSEPFVDEPSIDDWARQSRYGETGGIAPALRRGRVFCKYFSNEDSEIGVGLELEISIEVPDGVLRQTASVRHDEAAVYDDPAGRIAHNGSRLYKNLDVGPVGVTWKEAADRVNMANALAEQGRTNWRLPTPTELLELRDLQSCPDNLTPCCTLPALAVRSNLRYWTSKIDQAAPNFRICAAVSFSGSEPQLLDSPESYGCGVIVVSSD